jgi:hypothetical protein
MFGKKLSEYVQFVRWISILVAVAFVIRLGISLAGTIPTINLIGIETVELTTVVI